jgi:hypothetical protein
MKTIGTMKERQNERTVDRFLFIVGEEKDIFLSAGNRKRQNKTPREGGGFGGLHAKGISLHLVGVFLNHAYGT